MVPDPLFPPDLVLNVLSSASVLQWNRFVQNLAVFVCLNWFSDACPLSELFLLFCQIFNGILQLGTILYSAYLVANLLLTGMQALVPPPPEVQIKYFKIRSKSRSYLFSSWRQEIFKSDVCVFVWRIFLFSLCLSILKFFSFLLEVV